MPTQSKTIEFQASAKIDENGQLTIPKQFREDLRIGIGARVDVLRVGDGLVILRERRGFERVCERVRSALTEAGITVDEILATLPEARRRVFARRYGKTNSLRTNARRQSRSRR
jgi:AbrB family looped-hinge helix DNA binding protein